MNLRDRIRFCLKFLADLARHGIDGRRDVRTLKVKLENAEMKIKYQAHIIDTLQRKK